MVWRFTVTVHGRSTLSWFSMFGVRLKEHLLVYSRLILWTDRYSEVNSGIQVVFTRPIIERKKLGSLGLCGKPKFGFRKHRCHFLFCSFRSIRDDLWFVSESYIGFPITRKLYTGEKTLYRTDRAKVVEWTAKSFKRRALGPMFKFVGILFNLFRR